MFVRNFEKNTFFDKITIANLKKVWYSAGNLCEYNTFINRLGSKNNGIK